MKKEEKQKLVEGLEKDLKDATGIYFIDFTGLNAQRFRELRITMRKEDVKVKVVKNIVAKMAIEKLNLEDLLPLIDGPTALLYSCKDPIIPSKLIKEFNKENEFKVRGGFVEGNILLEDKIKDLALIPSRDELMQNLMFILTNAIQRLHHTISNPIQRFVMVIDQLSQRGERGG